VSAASAARAVARVPRLTLLLLVRAYQLLLSPLVGPVCRYAPSCSSYAAGALVTHGAVKGSWLAARRVLRCHPWAEGGWDPVPPAKGVPSSHHDPGTTSP
jgi:putative membrane protein insertion efficiency factor